MIILEDKLLTRSEVQQILRISISKMFQMIRKQELPVIKIGNSYRIRQSDLNIYLNQHQQNERGLNNACNK